MEIAIKKKILILGGKGFIGNTIYQSLKKKFIIKILSKRLGNDLRNPLILKRYLQNNKFTHIINCAANVGGLSYISKFGADVATDNLKIYINLYDSLKKIKNPPVVINLLSNCFYPEKLKIQKEHQWQDGKMHSSVEAFGIAKRVTIILSNNYEIQYNIKTINIILPNAFGPGDHMDPLRSHALNGIIIRMIKAKKEKMNKFEVWGTGKPRREWIYSEDIPKIILRLLKFKVRNNLIVNIAQNKSYSINQIAYIIKKNLSYKGKIINNKNYPDGAPLKQLNNLKFKKTFKNFSFTNFNFAVRKTIKSYLKFNRKTL